VQIETEDEQYSLDTQQEKSHPIESQKQTEAKEKKETKAPVFESIRRKF
jgi:hypothetical protein